MTGILIFTGFIFSISTQSTDTYCVAHSVSNCASVYGVKEDAINIARNELHITIEGYGNDLVFLNRHSISKLYKADKDFISSKIKNGPILMRIPQGAYIDNDKLIAGHHVCLVGETEENWVVASRSTGHGIMGYSQVKKDTDGLMFQDFGSGNLTAKNIIIGNKKNTSVKKRRFKKPTS